MYIILKKTSILLVSLLAITLLANCSGSSSSGGGDSNNNDTKKPPVEKAPETTCGENEVLNEETNQCESALPVCGEDEMLNENTSQCEPVLLTCNEDQFLIERECKDKVVFAEPAESATCNGELALSVEINNEEKCLTEDDNMFDFHVAVSGAGDGRKWENSNIEISLAANNATLTVQDCAVVAVSEDTPSTFTAEFSSYFSCDILAVDKDQTDQQVAYALNVVHDISQASDFEIPFFETAAARFSLTDDITLVAKNESIVTNFKGQLDGSNHTINGLSIDAAGTDSSDNVGFIGSMKLAGDATVVIKNLTLNVQKLIGRNFVAGLIAKLEPADSNVRTLQISDVTVTFDNAQVECASVCAGVIGWSNHKAKAELSNIRVTGDLNIGGLNTDATVSYVGGIIGSSYQDQLTNATANLNISISKPAEYVGLAVGMGDQINIKNVNAMGTMGLSGPSERIGGVVGLLVGSRIEQAKSVLTVNGQYDKNLMRNDLSSVGGTVGLATASQLSYIYSDLTAKAFRWTAIGGVVGSLSDSHVTYAVGSGNADARTEANIRYGGLVGVAEGVFSLSHVFSTGSIQISYDTQGVSSNLIGQMVGFITHKLDDSDTELDIDNCYTSGFSTSGDNEKQRNPATVLGGMVPNFRLKATVTKCYTAAAELLRVASDDGTTTNSYSLTEEDVVTDVMDANAAGLDAFDGAEGWTKEQGGISYTYPMLAYPDSMKDGPVSEEDWFEFQTQVNTVNTGS